MSSAIALCIQCRGGLTVVGLSNEHGGIHKVGVVLQVVVGVVSSQNKEDAGLEVLQCGVQAA